MTKNSKNQKNVAGHSDHGEDHQGHYAHMAADFKQRFWISLAPLIQELLGVRALWNFPGDPTFSSDWPLEALVKLIPSKDLRITEDGATEELPVSDLKAKDRVADKPGEKKSSNGNIFEGRTSIDESMITGESRHVEKSEGDEVIGGSVNGEAAIKVQIEKTGNDTYLSQVVDMVKKALESRSRAHCTPG